jgi:hypothetical protein
MQEKQKLSERQIEELSGRVSALELEKQELQRALEQARQGQQVASRSCYMLKHASAPSFSESLPQYLSGRSPCIM